MFKSRKIGTYPSLLIVTSLTIALFLGGFCALMALTSQLLVTKMKENIEVQVFLNKDLSESKKDSIGQAITREAFVQIQPNGKRVIAFVSKEKAAEQFKNDTKEDFATVLGENPFRDAFAVPIASEFFNEAQLNKVKESIEKIDGVFEADFPRNFVDEINKNIRFVAGILSIFVILMLLGVLFLVNNTIRLALYSQRFVIRSMQLVGATDGFIQKPYLKKGIFLGLSAALVAALFLVLIQNVAVSQIEALSSVSNYSNLILVILGTVIVGATMGALSTWIALNKYLKLDLEHLY